MSKTVVFPVRVEFGDCDPAGIVWYPNFFRWIDPASRFFFEQCGVPTWTQTTRLFGIIGTSIVDTKATFVKTATYGETLNVHVSVSEWRNKSFVLTYAVKRADVLIMQCQDVRIFAAKREDGTLYALPISPFIHALCNAQEPRDWLVQHLPAHESQARWCMQLLQELDVLLREAPGPHSEALRPRAVAWAEAIAQHFSSAPEVLIPAALCLIHAGRGQVAIAIHRRVLELAPGNPDAHVNLGLQLWRYGEFDAALAHAQQAVALMPHEPVCRRVLGEAYLQLNRCDEAIEHLAIAAKSPQEEGKAKRLLAFAALLKGDFEKGWQWYQWRWAGSQNMHRPEFYKPELEWDGGDPKGMHLLVYQEQGYGDILQFSRYIPLLIERGARVSMFLAHELRPLIGTVAPLTFCPQKEGEPPFDQPVDAIVPLLDLPLHFATRHESIPHQVPYLHVLPQYAQKWRRRLKPWAHRKKVGLVWCGRPSHDNDINRSFSLSLLAPLMQLELPNGEPVQAFSLQFFVEGLQGDVSDGDFWADLPPQALVDFMTQGDAQAQDWGDTAAYAAQMDALVVVDSALAHLGGALGLPTWLLLPSNPDWRWLIEGPTTPWYPSLRLDRRDKRESKSHQVARVCEAVRQFLSTAAKN